ncbi:hypothetical protein RI367_004884 [Sorochytrium milnesiophthora]
MVYTYSVTALPPSAVTHSTKGHFTGPDDLNLIVCRCSRLEVLTLTEQGVRSVLNEALLGRVSLMELFRPPGHALDLLFFCTERLQYAVLGWDQQTQRPVTLQSGSIRNQNGKLAESGAMGYVDAANGIAVLHLYNGLLKIVPLGTGISHGKLLESGVAVKELAGRHAAAMSQSFKYSSSKGKMRSSASGDNTLREVAEPFNMRLEEMQVTQLQQQLAAVDGTPLSKPGLVVMNQDAKGNRRVRSYAINAKEKELEAWPATKDTNPPAIMLDPFAHAVVPLGAPYGGMVIFSEGYIRYIAREVDITKKHADGRDVIINSWSYIDPDGSRVLLGDANGDLSIMYLTLVDNKPPEIHVQRLGTVSTPATLTYLDWGYAFVGSRFGDSCLIQLLEEPNEAGENLNVVQVWTNVGPISDLLVFSADTQNGSQQQQSQGQLSSGQGQIITCSGAFKDGSLRTVRHGIGITEVSQLNVPTIRRVWALQQKGQSGQLKSLIGISTLTMTTIMQFASQHTDSDMEIEGGAAEEDGAEMELKQLDMRGMVTDQQSLALGTLPAENLLVQVTASDVICIDLEQQTELWRWSPPAGKLDLASILGDRLACSVGKAVYLCSISARDLTVLRQRELSEDISALDLSAIQGDTAGAPSELYCCVGLWNNSNVAALSVPQLQPVADAALGNINARSVTMVRLEGVTSFLAGQGDGVLQTFVLDKEQSKFTDRRSIVLGTQPIHLTKFEQSGQTLVLCSSDRPTVLHSNNGKLMFSNLNLKSTLDICTVHLPGLGESVAVVSDRGFSLGTIDDIQNIHISTHALGGEMARRITHHTSSKSLCVLTERVDPDKESAFVRLLDDVTYAVRSTEALKPDEVPQSIMTMKTADTGLELIVVGTALVVPDEEEPKNGRIIAYQVDNDGRLQRYSEMQVDGAVYCLGSVRGLIVAGVNNRVTVHKLNSDTSSVNMELVCESVGHIAVLFLCTRGDFIILGDMMRAISVLLLDGDDKSLTVVAKDPMPMWCSAVADFDDENYIASDANYNLVVTRRNAGAMQDDEKRRLEVVGRFHIGELINKIRHGSIRANYHESQSIVKEQFVYGSVNGTIGILGTLNESDFSLLSTLAREVAAVYPSIGGLSFDAYRSFADSRKQESAHGFVDGDMVERFLDLSDQDKATVTQAVNGHFKANHTAKTLTKLVEELTLLH